MISKMNSNCFGLSPTLGERTTANGLEHATRRRLGTTGSTRLGWGSGTSPARHDDEFQLWSTTATAVSSGGEGENKEGVRGGARAGRGRGLGVQFIEEGGDEREGERGALGGRNGGRRDGIHQRGRHGEG